MAELGKQARIQGYLTKDELLRFFDWKTRRRGRSRCLRNDENYIKEITRFAFTTSEDRLRIEVLTLLDGVQWPIASAILHFVFPENYPILDFRALWSLGIEKPPPYCFRFWKAYTDTCKMLSEANNISLRTLDRALWQYSKEKQSDQKPV